MEAVKSVAETTLKRDPDGDRKFLALLEASSAAVVVVKPNWEVIDFNDAWPRFLGYEPDELRGVSPRDVTHADDLNASVENINSLISGEADTYRVEKRYIRKDGGVVWGDLSAKALRDDEGRLELVIATVVDVTNYKNIQAELANRVRDLNFQKFAVDQHAIVSMADAKGDITYANDMFCQISGYSRDELMGQNHRIVKSGEHPPEFYQDLWQTIASGKVWQGDMKNKKKDGSFYWTKATIVPYLDHAGNPFQYISIRTDITDRKDAETQLVKSERRFRAVAQSNRDAIISVDSRGAIIQWNDGAENTFGYTAEEVVGRDVTLLVPEMYRESHQAGFARAMEGRETSLKLATIEVEALHKDGGEFPIELSLSAWSVEGERFVTSIIRNISRMKQTQENLLTAKQEAEKANKAKTQFLANISHELRTPLNAIIGFSEIMTQELFGPLGQPQYVDYVGDIHTSGRHLLSLINEILDMSKIEAREYAIHTEFFDIREIVDEALTFLKVQARDAEIDLRALDNGDLPPVFADKRASKQVLINLLSNAIKFTAEGGTVTAGASLAGEKILVEVADTGIGMSPEALDRAFEPFVQVEREKNRFHEGTGLGLPLSKNLVRLQGGELTLQSVRGQGTTATFTLPTKETG